MCAGPFPLTGLVGNDRTSSVVVDDQTFTGDVVHTGTLSGAPVTIVVASRSTITGPTIDSGIVATTHSGVGISVNCHSKITGTTFSIEVAARALPTHRLCRQHVAGGSTDPTRSLTLFRYGDHSDLISVSHSEQPSVLILKETKCLSR